MADGLKLHLGCGGVYLDGYRNIDLPVEAHGVQDAIRPDVYADITTLEFPPESVSEIRLHHVFEHFRRPTALRLLIDWYGWLEPGGQLMIETPDFARCARTLLWKRSPADQMKILRHVFGSQEADWALHCDGWYAAKFRWVLGELGFEKVRARRSAWRGTFNVTVRSRKPLGPPRSREELMEIADRLLRLSLVDESATEQRILEVWRSAMRRPAGSSASGPAPSLAPPSGAHKAPRTARPLPPT